MGRRHRSGQAKGRACPPARRGHGPRHGGGEGGDRHEAGAARSDHGGQRDLVGGRGTGGAGEPGEAEGGQVSFLRARTANEVIKAQTAKVRLQKMKGDLVDRNRAVAAVFDLARRERHSWLNLPPRVAANMAAELGVEAHRMELVLDRMLRAHLAEMAEVKLEFR